MSFNWISYKHRYCFCVYTVSYTFINYFVLVSYTFKYIYVFYYFLLHLIFCFVSYNKLYFVFRILDLFRVRIFSNILSPLCWKGWKMWKMISNLEIEFIILKRFLSNPENMVQHIYSGSHLVYFINPRIYVDPYELKYLMIFFQWKL